MKTKARKQTRKQRIAALLNSPAQKKVEAAYRKLRPRRRKKHRRPVQRFVELIGLRAPEVIDFGDPSLREAFRIWWQPFDMGSDFDEMTGARRLVVGKKGKRGKVLSFSNDRNILSGAFLERRRLDPDYFRRQDRAFRSITKARRPKPEKVRKEPVRVRIMLTYPLTEPRSKVVTIDRRYPGEIFGLTHDFYREIYAEDKKRGGKEGPHEKGKGPLLNRGCGPLVWGHDLGDLCFEQCFYDAFSAEQQKQFGVEGEFTFGIGS